MVRIQNPRVALDEPFQLLLAPDKRQGPQIVTVERQAIERVKYRFAPMPQEFVKLRPAGGVEHHNLSVEHGFRIKLPQRGTQRSERLVHVPAARDELAMAGSDVGQGAEAVVLQLCCGVARYVALSTRRQSTEHSAFRQRHIIAVLLALLEPHSEQLLESP